MDDRRRQAELALRNTRHLHGEALRTEARRSDAAVVRDGVTWADFLAMAVRPARHTIAYLHGLGWEQLTDDERPEVLRLDADLRRLAALARDNGCTLVGCEKTSSERLPGDMPADLTPD